MKFVRLVLLIVLGLFILYVKLTTSGTNSVVPPATPPNPALQQPASPAPANAQPPPATPGATNAAQDSSSSVPAKAVQVLQYVRQNGQPPDGYVGGRTFENREGRLPAGGDYREFDVDPHNGQRNAERLIVEWTTKKAWYTGDHYQTFIPVP